MLRATCNLLSLQTNLAESQQSCSAKEDQLQSLSLELESAQANASDLARSHTETEQQLQQQKALLKQVQGQSTLKLSLLLPSANQPVHCACESTCSCTLYADVYISCTGYCVLAAAIFANNC